MNSDSIQTLSSLVYGTRPKPDGAGSLLFILGPCVIESEKFLWDTAREIKTICAERGATWVLKASYDKANRTSGRSYRGMPAREGCQLLAAVGREMGVPVTTDVHSPAEAELAAEWIDVLQIPAFLCRQTDLIQTAAATGRVVNVKKGQFLSPWDVRPIAEKLQAAGSTKFFFTERGVSFGYQNLVADMRSLYWMRQAGFLVCFDATHSVQRPGAGGDHTSGDGELAPVLARAAVATGCDGVFMEVHEDPSKALSDGPNQIPLRQLAKLLATLQKFMKLRAPKLLVLVLSCLSATLPLHSQEASVGDTPPPLGAETPPLPSVSTPPLAAPQRGAKRNAPKDSTPKPQRVKKPKEIPFVLPIGNSGHDIKIPQVDLAGQLLQLLKSGKITRVDDEHVEMHETKIDLYHPDGKEDFHVLLPDSILDLKTNVISSVNPVTVRTEDFELTGERMQFNTVDRTGELQGHVHMVIHNLKQVAGVTPATPAP